MKGPRSPKARTQLVKSSEGFCPKCDSKIISCAYSLLQKGIWSAYLLAGSRSITEVNPNYAPAYIHIPVLQWKHTQDRHTQYVWACLHSAIRTGIITLTPTNYKWGHSILLYTPIVLACFSYPKLTWVQATSFQIGSCLGTCTVAAQAFLCPLRLEDPSSHGGFERRKRCRDRLKMTLEWLWRVAPSRDAVRNHKVAPSRDAIRNHKCAGMVLGCLAENNSSWSPQEFPGCSWAGLGSWISESFYLARMTLEIPRVCKTVKNWY